MRLASFLLLSSLSLPSYAVFCPFPADTSDPNQGLSLGNGYGFDMDRDRIKPLPCVEGVIQTVGTPTATYSMVLSKNLAEYVQSVTKSFGGGLKIFGIGGGASRSVTNTFIQKNYSSTLSLEYHAYLGTDAFVPNGNNPLTKTAQDASADYCNFKRVCGTHFVYQTEKGATVTMAFRFLFDSNETKVGFDNSFNLSADVKIYKVPVSVSLSKSSSTASDSVKQRTQVEVYMFQEGGDVAALGKALGSTNGEDAPIAICGLNNLAACDAAISKAINYLASDTFINGIKAQPAILNQALRPFWEIEPHLYALGNSEVTPAITTARNNLANEYLKRSADLSTAQQLLSSSLTAAHKASLQSLVSSLTSEIDKIRSTALICYSDLSQCEAKTNQLLNTLTVYDPNVLKFHLDDGLVAHYPFDGNALDASGNGNNGTVYGATLTKDRNGKDNSAYKFNAADSNYIKLPPFELGSQMSVSMWVLDSNIYGWWHRFFEFGTGYQNTDDYLVLALKMDTGKLIFQTSSFSDYTVMSTSLLPQNQWLHVVATIDANGNSDIYQDGKLIATAHSSIPIPTVARSNQFIGKSRWTSSPPNAYFDGIMDDIRIYNRALTPDEITQLYTGNTTSPSTTVPPSSVTIARLINISANAKLPIIGGLGISGTGTLRLMFRGFAIDSCVDPIIILQKYPSGEEVARNNDWQTGGSIAGSIQNLPSHLTLTNPKDAGLLIDLPVGYYTISLGSNGCNGQGLIGVDLIESASSPTAKLINLSANAPVPIIGGLGMSGSGNMKAMFRGFQVDPCVDANLLIQKYPSGEFFASNNDWWTDSNSAQVAALPSYLQLPKSSDAGLLRDLTPQYFTATLSSNTACSGNGLFGLDMVQ